MEFWTQPRYISPVTQILVIAIGYGICTLIVEGAKVLIRLIQIGIKVKKEMKSEK